MSKLQTLDEVTIAQHVWKSPTMQVVAEKILRVAVDRGLFWPDEINFDDIPDDDKNCIGTTFRYLKNLGLITRCAAYRKSKAKATKGRVIFSYALRSRTLAMALLHRIKPSQPREGYLI